MTRTVITTENAPALAAPLSQGIRKGPLLQVSGQFPLDPDTGEIVGITVAEQTAQALRNVTAVLKMGGAGLEDVVMLRVYLTDPAHLAEMNARSPKVPPVSRPDYRARHREGRYSYPGGVPAFLVRDHLLVMMTTQRGGRA